MHQRTGTSPRISRCRWSTRPRIASNCSWRSLAQMTAAVWDPEGMVDGGLKRLIAHVASRAAGSQYCMAHTAGGTLHFGVEDKKLAAYGSIGLARFTAVPNASRWILPPRRPRCRHGRNVCRIAQALERRANRRNRRCDCAVRLSQSLERHVGHAA